MHWRTSQLHWTDQLYERISVSDLDGNKQSSLIHSELDIPQAIALDPDNGYALRTCLLVKILLGEFCLFTTQKYKKLSIKAMFKHVLTYLVEVAGFIMATLQRAELARKAQ